MGIETAIPDDGGVTRRAIKRWIYVRIADGDMLAVRSGHGQVLRLSTLA